MNNFYDVKLTFDDVMMIHRYSEVGSRKNVNPSVILPNGRVVKLPVVSANMDSITDGKMALYLEQQGSIGCIHRFCTVAENIKMVEPLSHAWVSCGVSEAEQNRAYTLLRLPNVECLTIDIAHAAQKEMVEFVDSIFQFIENEKLENKLVVVGNFGSPLAIQEFASKCKSFSNNNLMLKLGVGNGGACSTTVTTGIGYPQLSLILDTVEVFDKFIISDGGHKKPADVCKALAAGSSLVMLGGMFAGTDKAATNIYRGSASSDSYKVQGKDNLDYITAEGVAFGEVESKPTSDVLKTLEGGLRSSMTYLGASSLTEYRNKCYFIRVGQNSTALAYPHFKS